MRHKIHYDELNNDFGNFLKNFGINFKATKEYISYIAQKHSEYDRLFDNTDHICTKNLQVQEAMITKKYGSLKNYEDQCKFFANFDCEKFDPETSDLLSFAKKVWGFVSKLYQGGNCIGAILQTKPEFTKSLSEYFKKTYLDKIFNSMGDHAAHLLTLGVWGGLKAGYHLVELGLKIKDFYDGLLSDPAFSLGGIVGKVILIIKSILVGRRRRFKK